MIFRTVLIATLVLFFISISLYLPAANWYVDCSVASSGSGTSPQEAFKTIQEAVNAAVSGDTVTADAGVYYENVYLFGKNIALLGSGAPITIIDGGNSDSVITLTGEETDTCVISGFTVRYGQATHGGGICGGTEANPTHARIENNIILSNSALNSGGGMAFCDGIIQDTTISQNSAGIHGAGLYKCNGTIQNNSVTDNLAASDGGGLYDCNAAITECNVSGNSAANGGGLGGCDGPIVGNTVSGNSAGNDGGGLSDCVGPIENNVIDGNDAGNNGGGLHACSGDITSNTVTANEAYEDGGGLSDCDGTVAHNQVTGNTAHDEGGGLYACGGIIHDNTISDNSANAGGGLSRCSGPIQGNTFTGNSASGDGGALNRCSGLIDNNLIENNSAREGGGLHWCESKIEDNTIRQNKAWNGGGLTRCHGMVYNNAITDNSADAEGGGLYGCSGTVRRNTISGNTARDGGGIAHTYGLIEFNVISGNSAGGTSPWARGGGLYDLHGGAILKNNYIIGNTAVWQGGGLYYCYAQTTAVRNNLFAGNSATGSPVQEGWGGAVSECIGLAVLENNTIVGNSADRGGGLYECTGGIRNCIIWGNTAPVDSQLANCTSPTFCCIQDYTGSGEGNINLNPRFVDADGPDNDPNTYEDNDYRLSTPFGVASPCTDTGDNQAWMTYSSDLDGNRRLFCGNPPCARGDVRVDMGAYEYGSFKFSIVHFLRERGGVFVLTWNSRAGDSYTVLSSRSLRPGLIPTWIEETTVRADGQTTTWTDPNTESDRKFYRVEISN